MYDIFSEMDRITDSYLDSLPTNPRDPNYDTRKDEAKQAKIDELAAIMLAENDEIERVIAENPDVVRAIWQSGTDIKEKMTESIKHWIELDAEKFYE